MAAQLREGEGRQGGRGRREGRENEERRRVEGLENTQAPKWVDADNI